MRVFAYTLVFLFMVWGCSTAYSWSHDYGASNGPSALRVLSANERIAKNDTVSLRISSYWRVDPGRGTRLAAAAIQRAQAANDSISLALGYYALGVNQWALGQNVNAARSYFTAIAIAQSTGNRVILAMTYNNLGLLYFALKTYQEAQSWFIRAHDLRRQLSDSVGIARVHTNLGLVARKHGKFDSARSCFSAAIEMFLKSGDLNNLARTTHYLGEIDAATGDPKGALLKYNRADALFRDLPDRMGHALLLVDIAKAYHKLGDTKAALQYSIRALSLGRKMNSPFTIKEAADILHSIYAAKGDYRSAYEMSVESGRFADSLRSESAMHAIANMELQSLLEHRRSIERSAREKREMEIQTELQGERQARNIMLIGLMIVAVLALVLAFGLRQIKRKNSIILEKNKEIGLINERLQRIDESREKLFSIIGHDLRGPVGAIYSIGQLLQDREAELSNAEKEHLLDAIILSARTTHELLDNLLNWSRSRYGNLSFNPVENDVDTMIREQLMVTTPVAQKKNISLHDTGQKDLHCVCDGQMISAVIRNLVMNAIKFTNDGGEITIDTSNVDGMLSIAVRDTGIGMSPEYVEKLLNNTRQTSVAGTHGEHGTGLGLEICREFLDRHSGTLSIESQEGEGSTFIASFPISPLASTEYRD